MSLDRHPDWRATVRANWKKTTAFLMASTQPCIHIRDDELAAIRENRVLVGLGSRDLEAWSPPASWMLAVMLCPGDDTKAVTAWARENRVDFSRVHFYLHPKTDPVALQAWHEAGFPTERADSDVDSWKRLHQLLGLALSDRIASDWGESARAGNQPGPGPGRPKKK
jgi:hypothetical protein